MKIDVNKLNLDEHKDNVVPIKNRKQRRAEGQKNQDTQRVPKKQVDELIKQQCDSIAANVVMRYNVSMCEILSKRGLSDKDIRDILLEVSDMFAQVDTVDRLKIKTTKWSNIFGKIGED